MAKKTRGFLKSFHHAGVGIGMSLRGRNFIIQLIMAIVAVVAGIYFSLSMSEWLIVVLLIFSVLAVETLNTAIEEVCNVVKDLPGISSPQATRSARDIAAGSALLISLSALIIGILVFAPKIAVLF